MDRRPSTPVKGVRIRRKVFHLILGVLFILSMLANWDLKWFFLTVLCAGTAVSFIQDRRELPLITWFLDRYDKKDDIVPGEGPLSFFLGAVLTWFFFPQSIAVAAMIAISFGDPMAYLGGTVLGGPTIPWNRSKTWSGTVLFMITASLVVGVIFGPIEGILIGSIAGIIESIKWPLKVIMDDNVTVPFFSSTFIWVLGLFLPLF